MQNYPPKNQHFAGENYRTHLSDGASKRKKRRSIPSRLIATEFKPFVLIGKCMRQFGVRAVAGFLLGGAMVYGYGIVKGLPGLRVAVGQKTVWLHGRVKENDKPLKEEFEIGVLATKNGPFQDGSYSIQVPESNSYRITLWNADHQKFKIAELRADSSGNVADVNVPAWTTVEGPANQAGGSTVSGSAEDRRPESTEPLTPQKETDSRIAARHHSDKRR